MPSYQRTSIVDADFEAVWAFYDSIEELKILTPDWLGLQVASIVGPDGEEPDGYEVGTVIALETRPLDLFTISEWTVEIVDREVSETRAQFVDEQVGDQGPFGTWRHTHRFAKLGEGTMVHDHVEYELPFDTDLPLATPVLAAMLWYRHRRTRELLE